MSDCAGFPRNETLASVGPIKMSVGSRQDVCFTSFRRKQFRRQTFDQQTFSGRTFGRRSIGQHSVWSTKL